MGCFSWKFANNEGRLRIGHRGYLYCPNGDVIRENEYDGYGRFNDEDVYDLVADWNREYFSEHPEFLVPQAGYVYAGNVWLKAKPKRIDSFPWYPAYSNLALNREEVVEAAKRSMQKEYFEYRFIGIEIACYDVQNAALPYPIKIASRIIQGIDER